MLNVSSTLGKLVKAISTLSSEFFYYQRDQICQHSPASFMSLTLFSPPFVEKPGQFLEMVNKVE